MFVSAIVASLASSDDFIFRASLGVLQKYLGRMLMMTVTKVRKALLVMDPMQGRFEAVICDWSLF